MYSLAQLGICLQKEEFKLIGHFLVERVIKKGSVGISTGSLTIQISINDLGGGSSCTNSAMKLPQYSCVGKADPKLNDCVAVKMMQSDLRGYKSDLKHGQ